MVNLLALHILWVGPNSQLGKDTRAEIDWFLGLFFQNYATYNSKEVKMELLPQMVCNGLQLQNKLYVTNVLLVLEAIYRLYL